eukprot:ANDGO_01877.mRNA.1 hypothetical protein
MPLHAPSVPQMLPISSTSHRLWTTMLANSSGAWFAAIVDVGGITASFTLALAQHSFNFSMFQSLGEARMFGLRYFAPNSPSA